MTAAAAAAARVVVVDDHPTVRAGTQALLAAAGHQILGQAATLADTTHLVHTLRPDLLIADLDLGTEHTPTIFSQLLTAVPGLKILVLSVHDELSYVRESLAAGAAGYLLKDAPADELATAVTAVLSGQTYLQPSLAVRLARRSPDAALNDRERKLLDLVAAGHTNASIAEHMHLSVRSIETIRADLRRRLNLPDRAALITYARHTQHR